MNKTYIYLTFSIIMFKSIGDEGAPAQLESSSARLKALNFAYIYLLRFYCN